MSYFTNLRIEKIVIHEIFKREDSGSLIEPKYNDHLSRLNREGISTLQSRIVNALGDDSHSIEMKVTDDSSESIFQKGAKLLHSSHDRIFIDISREITLKLAESQRYKTIPGGIVLLFSGKTGLNNNSIWGIIKADPHEGFSKEVIDEELVLKYITELLLTPQQRLYKLAVFVEEGITDTENGERVTDDFKCFVYDHNLTKNETQQAALYFFRDFLGCEYSPTDKKLTRDFYYETKSFIQNLDLDPDEKGELHTALFTYLKVSQEQTIHVQSFADEYLAEPLRQDFIEHLEGKGIPTRAISKDLTYIKTKLRQRKVTFTNNVKIIAPADDFGNLVWKIRSM